MDWAFPVAALERPPIFSGAPVTLQFPHTASALLEELERLVPERVPEAGDSMEAIQRYAGKRELVLMLKNWRDAAKRAADRPTKPRGRR